MIRHAHRVADVLGDEREERLFRRIGVGQVERVHLQIGVAVAVNQGEERLTLLGVANVDHSLEGNEEKVRN